MPRSSSDNPRLAEQTTGFRTVLANIAITIGYVLNPLNGSLGVPILPLALGLQAFVQGEPVVPYVSAFLLALAVIAFGIVRSGKSREQLKASAIFASTWDA